MSPAFRDIWAFGALADGMQVFALEEIGDGEEVLMRGKPSFQPGWLFFGL
jgi:hypothetical protein